MLLAQLSLPSIDLITLVCDATAERWADVRHGCAGRQAGCHHCALRPAKVGGARCCGGAAATGPDVPSGDRRQSPHRTRHRVTARYQQGHRRVPSLGKSRTHRGEWPPPVKGTKSNRPAISMTAACLPSSGMGMEHSI